MSAERTQSSARRDIVLRHQQDRPKKEKVTFAQSRPRATQRSYASSIRYTARIADDISDTSLACVLRILEFLRGTIMRFISMEIGQIIVPQRDIFFGEPASHPPLLLSDLPLDIINDIFDALEWHEKLFFSQTCRSPWHKFRSKCCTIFRNATLHERRGYMVSLECMLPDYYLCQVCRGLHFIGPKDASIPSRGNYHVDIYQSDPCPIKHLQSHRASPSFSFSGIGFWHVQMALKCARLMGTHLLHARRLTQGFRRDTLLSGLLERWVRVERRVSVKPRLVNGRFLVKFKYRIEKAGRKLMYGDVVNSQAILCPHQFLGMSCDHNVPIRQVLQYIFGDPNSATCASWRYSCNKCPTDFNIVIMRSTASIVVWHDLGKGESAEDPYWTSHLWRIDNNGVVGTKFKYEHGSIEMMYELDQALLSLPPSASN